MPKKLTFEYVKNFINKEQLLISTEYINNKALLEIQCNICKEHYNQNFDRYKNGHRHQKCSNNLNSIIALKKRYNTDIFIKDTIKICEWCKENYNPKRSIQKLCNQKCAINYTKTEEYKKKSILNGSKGGKASAASQKTRSKNEIAFAELCIQHFGENDILCNQQIFKDKNGNMWDCDIYIKSLGIAILYDGWYWHYRPNVSKKQKARDQLKRQIIVDNGYEYYTIIDKGRFNKKFVEEQFNLFLQKY
jgi:hypothetical protein